MNPESTKVAAALYGEIMERVVPVSTSRVAEATKLLENIYRAVNIALVNELKMTFDRMGIDVWEVIEAAKTKPFGFQAFYPGPGLGGHCIPLDPFYLTWKAAEYGAWTRFIELAGEINTGMPAVGGGEVRGGALRRGQEREGRQSAGAGPVLQGRYRRRPRVALLRAHRVAAEARRGCLLLRPPLPGLASGPCGPPASWSRSP